MSFFSSHFKKRRLAIQQYDMAPCAPLNFFVEKPSLVIDKCFVSLINILSKSEVKIPSKEETMTNFAAVLNASVNASISIATYTVSGAVLTITYDAGGVDGNAYTLANSSGAAAVTRSAATLAGGSNTVGGISLAQNTMFLQNARDLPSIREAVYVVSATDAAKVNYTYG
jgi:hypothetical protein